MFDFQFGHFWMLLICVVEHSPQTQQLWKVFPTKCQGQNKRMECPVVLFVCQTLDLLIGFATTQISMFTLPVLLRFLCLVNSLHKRYVSCIYNISNISNRSDISSLSNVNTCFNKSNSIDPMYTSTFRFRKRCRRYSCDWFYQQMNKRTNKSTNQTNKQNEQIHIQTNLPTFIPNKYSNRSNIHKMNT